MALPENENAPTVTSGRGAKQQDKQPIGETKYSIEVGIRLGAACFVGVAIASWCSGVGPVLGGAV